MAFADAVVRMQDAQYSTMGVACSWTPAGGEAVSFTGLRAGEDETAPVHGLVGDFAAAPRMVRVRIRELAPLAPGVTPADGDAVTTPDGDFVITGAVITRGARRLEWLMSLADA